MKCEIRDSKFKVVAIGRREGSPYYFDHGGPTHQGSDQKESKSSIWHCRFGHLGMQGLQELVKGKMVTGLDISSKSELTFCESCVQGKSHRLPFQQSSVKRTSNPLELIHIDVGGKVGTQSLGSGEYFVTFLDDHTRYVWVYILNSVAPI